MDDAATYAAEVERILAAACAMFPTERGTPPSPAGVLPTPVRSPGGPSELSSAADEAARAYHADQAKSARTVTGIDRVNAQARSIAAGGRDAAAAVRHAASTNSAAVMPIADTPEGVVLLVSTLDEYMAAMQIQIDDVKAQFTAATALMNHHREQLTEIGGA